ncbi:hypothetical protein MPS01_17530 [Marinilactibacillus psychrotolerans]|nr:hypothetical protein MPS01_17530 [Marinilactibacillus psychrotolerans]
MGSKGANGMSLDIYSYYNLRTSLSIEVSFFHVKVLNYSSLTQKGQSYLYLVF